MGSPIKLSLLKINPTWPTGGRGVVLVIISGTPVCCEVYAQGVQRVVFLSLHTEACFVFFKLNSWARRFGVTCDGVCGVP